MKQQQLEEVKKKEAFERSLLSLVKGTDWGAPQGGPPNPQKKQKHQGAPLKNGRGKEEEGEERGPLQSPPQQSARGKTRNTNTPSGVVAPDDVHKSCAAVVAAAAVVVVVVLLLLLLLQLLQLLPLGLVLLLLLPLRLVLLPPLLLLLLLLCV